jgi:trigger factor
MTATLTQHTPTRMSLEITVPAKEVTAAYDAVVASIAPKVRIPGFRPGKAPKAVLLQKYGREVQQDVTDRLVKRHFWEQVQQAGVQPISNPSLDKLELKDGADALFRAQFDIAPSVSLPDYKTIELTKRKRVIDDAAVAEHLEGMRSRATKFMPVEEAATEGSIVTCDIKAKIQGRKPQTYSDQAIEVSAERPFDKELLGHKADDVKSFTVVHGDEAPNLKGKSVQYDVTIKDVRRREVPELGDELAKDLGFDDLAAMTAAVRKDLEDASERDAQARLQTTLLDSLLDSAPFEVPRSMIALQLDDYCQEFAQTVARQGIDPRRINWTAYRQHRANDAERAVRSGYLLQTIGNTEDIQVSDEEIDTDIKSYMEENKVQQPFPAFKAELEQRGTTTEIKGRIRTDKIFQHLLGFSKVTEELLDAAAFQELLELERKRETGEAINRFDAGGLEGGGFEDQEGGNPDAVLAAEHVHGPDCDHDHDHGHHHGHDHGHEHAEAKPKKAAKKAEKSDKAEGDEKPKKAAKKK